MASPARVKNQNKQPSKVFASVSRHHSGPLPSPQTLVEYDEIVPGSAQAIMDAFHNQTEHRMRLENRAIDSQLRRASWGQIFGFILGLVGLGGSIFCIYNGHDTAGATIGSVSLASLVSIFVVGKKTIDKDLENKR